MNSKNKCLVFWWSKGNRQKWHWTAQITRENIEGKQLKMALNFNVPDQEENLNFNQVGLEMGLWVSKKLQ